MQLVAEDQRPHIRRLPQPSLGVGSGTVAAEVAGAKGVTAVHGRIRGSSHTALGVTAWAARSANSLCDGLGQDHPESKQGHDTQSTGGHSHHSEKGDLGGLGIIEKEGITKLLGREFNVMVEGRHTVQPSTSSLTTENSMASLKRQWSDNLSEQVLVMITSPGLKFIAYSTELCLVVSRVSER